MRISFFTLSLALCWLALTLLPHAQSSLAPPPPISTEPTGHSPTKAFKLWTAKFPNIDESAKDSYTPTVGIETEVIAFATSCVKAGIQESVIHEQVVAATKEKSPLVKALPLSYIQLDGVTGKTGHMEFTLGPHSLEALKTGLTDQQNLIRTLSAQTSGQGVHPIEEVLKKVVHVPEAYNLTVDKTKCEEPARWEYKSTGTYPDSGVDTQITYSFPLAKVTSDAYAQMPRSPIAKHHQRFQAAKTFAEQVMNDYPKLRDDLEVAGLLTLFFHFAAGLTLCNFVNGQISADANCLKNWDGQQIKANLWAISKYKRHTNPHYFMFVDQILNNEGVRGALITRFYEFLKDEKNGAVPSPHELSLLEIPEYFNEHMRHLVFLLVAPTEVYSKQCDHVQYQATLYLQRQKRMTPEQWQSLSHQRMADIEESVKNDLLTKSTAEQYDTTILEKNVYSGAMHATPPFSPYAFKHIYVKNVRCKLVVTTKEINPILVTIGDKKHLYIVADRESRFTGTDTDLSKKTFTNRAFAPLSSVDFAHLDKERLRHWKLLAALQKP